MLKIWQHWPDRKKVFFEKSGHKTDNDVQVFGICMLSGLENINLSKTGSFTELYLLSSGPGGTTEIHMCSACPNNFPY